VRDVLRNAKDIAVIPLHQLAERFQVAFFGGLNECQLVENILVFMLDGFHGGLTQLIYYVWHASGEKDSLYRGFFTLL
jgi:hypothetical protein